MARPSVCPLMGRPCPLGEREPDPADVPFICPQAGRPLTRREVEVLQARIDYGRHELAARALGLSYWAVKSHMMNILAKLRAHSTAEAAVRAYQAGLVTWHGNLAPEYLRGGVGG